MKATIELKPFQPKKGQRWRQGLWFLVLWGAGVLTLMALVYGLRLLLDPLLGA